MSRDEKIEAVERIINKYWGLVPPKVLATALVDAIGIDVDGVLYIFEQERLNYSPDYLCDLAEQISDPDIIKIKEPT